MYQVPVYQPSLKGNEKKYVMDCLESTWISSKGEYISRFETAFCEFSGIKHSSTVANGTVALHLALLALGVGPEDEVIVPTLTYIASVNAISYVGATPVFVDSLVETWQVDPNDIERKITSKTRAIMVVHLYGHPCDMNEIMRIANKHALLVVEDCAEAFGAYYKGRHVGSFGDIATFSFFGNKTITTGEGGMVCSRTKSLHDRVVLLKGQGLACHRQYWHDVIGYNFRMTNICAAIGLAQLERAAEIIEAKRNLFLNYQNGLKGLPVRLLGVSDGIVNSFWMISMLCQTNDEREALRKWLETFSIETRPLFYPIHTMPMYSKKYEEHPVAESIGLSGINLPSWPDLSKDNIELIVGAIRKFYEKT